MKKLFFSLLFFLVIGGGVLSVIFFQSRKKDQDAWEKRLLKIERRTIEKTLNYVAIAHAAQSNPIHPVFNGTITRLFVKDGDWVNVDDPLMEVEATQQDYLQLKNAQSEVQLASTEWEDLMHQHKRRKNNPDLFPLEEISRLEKQIKIQKEVLDQRKNHLLSLLDVYGLKSPQEIGAKKFYIRSPLSGEVIDLMKEEGDLLCSRKKDEICPLVMHLINLQKIKLHFSIPQSEEALVQVDQKIQLQPRGASPLEGSITMISPKAVQESGVAFFPVIASFDNERKQIKPNTSIPIQITLEQKKDCLAVPLEGLYFWEDRVFLDVVHGKEARLQEIQIGLQDVFWVEIQEREDLVLKEGQQILKPDYNDFDLDDFKRRIQSL